eukprot:1838940-Rhodomonas_salina.1
MSGVAAYRLRRLRAPRALGAYSVTRIRSRKLRGTRYTGTVSPGSPDVGTDSYLGRICLGAVAWFWIVFLITGDMPPPPRCKTRLYQDC